VATPHQKNCVKCTQLIPVTAVHCVFCGATQPAKAANPEVMKTVMGMPAMRLPTPVPGSLPAATGTPAKSAAAAPSTPSSPASGAGAGAPAAKAGAGGGVGLAAGPSSSAAPSASAGSGAGAGAVVTAGGAAAGKPGPFVPGGAPAPAAGPGSASGAPQGFTPVTRGSAAGTAAPVVVSQEVPGEHKPTLLGLTASDVEAHLSSARSSSGSSAYALDAAEPADSLKKTIIGGIPSPVLGGAAAPIMGGAAAPGAGPVKKTVAMSAPVARSGDPSSKIEIGGGAAGGGPGVPEDLPTTIDGGAEERAKAAERAANIVGAPGGAGADGVEPSDSQSATKDNIKLSDLDDRLKGGAGDDAKKAGGEAADEGAILHGEAAVADARATAEKAAASPAQPTAVGTKEDLKQPTSTGGGVRLGAIVFGLVLVGAFVMPLSTGDGLVFTWDALAEGVDFWALVPFLAPLAGLVALVVGFVKMPPVGRGLVLAVFGAAGVGMTVAHALSGGDDRLFLVVPAATGGYLLLGGLLLAPLGLFARAMNTASMAARIVAALGAVLILASLLIPLGGDIPLLGIVEGFSVAPILSAVMILPAVLALASLAVFAPASTRAGTGVIAVLFLVWALASLPVWSLTFGTVDLGILKNVLPAVAYYFLLTGGAGQIMAGGTPAPAK
jgi:hypothetical protein